MMTLWAGKRGKNSPNGDHWWPLWRQPDSSFQYLQSREVLNIKVVQRMGAGQFLQQGMEDYTQIRNNKYDLEYYWMIYLRLVDISSGTSDFNNIV